MDFEFGFLRSDLNEILSRSALDLEKMRNGKILLLGGTGFVGRWLVSTLVYANRNLNLDISIHVGTRDVRKAKDSWELFSNPDVNMHDALELGRLSGFDFLVHGATPSRPETGGLDGNQVLKSTEFCTNELLSIARKSHKPNMMHLSSGIVYGERRDTNVKISERKIYSGNFESSYARAKHLAEIAVADATRKNLVSGCNPRLFSFAGPLISTSGHFAIGDFMRMGRLGGQIEVQGNPQSTRSYMYPTDMVTWLLSFLVNPSLSPINVGSEDSKTMLEIASLVAELFDCRVAVVGSAKLPESHYVPDVRGTKSCYGVSEDISVQEALRRWGKWLDFQPGSLSL